MRKTLLTVGESAPWFVARCTTNPQFHFDTIAGRYVVLCFFQTKGKRYAFLPFLYDDAAAQIREANRKYLGPNPPPSPPGG